MPGKAGEGGFGAERLLWLRLRGHYLDGRKFPRPVPVEALCRPNPNLGGGGFVVLSLSAEEVLKSLDSVLATISRECAPEHDLPSRRIPHAASPGTPRLRGRLRGAERLPSPTFLCAIADLPYEVRTTYVLTIASWIPCLWAPRPIMKALTTAGIRHSAKDT